MRWADDFMKPLQTLLGLFIAGFLAYGIGVYGFTQFLPAVEAEFHWGRAMLGGTMSAFWLAAPFVFISRMLLDRIGLRGVLVVGAACEATALGLMAFLTSPFEMYLLRFLMGIGKVLIVTPIPIALARTFHARTGLALAVALAGWHVGGIVMAPVSAALISLTDWRHAAVILAVVLAVVMAGAVLLLQANPSSHIALDTAEGPRESDPRNDTSPRSNAALAIGTIAFYMGYAALLSHLTSLLNDEGFASTTVASAMGSTALCAAAGVLLGGVVTQFLLPRVAGALVLALMAVVELGAGLMNAGGGIVALVSLVALLGVLIGAGDPIIIEALRRSVRADRFGKAYTWWYLLCLLTLSVAPVLAGGAYDRFGSYRAAFTVMGGFSLSAALLWGILIGERK